MHTGLPWVTNCSARVASLKCNRFASALQAESCYASWHILKCLAGLMQLGRAVDAKAVVAPRKRGIRLTLPFAGIGNLEVAADQETFLAPDVHELPRCLAAFLSHDRQKNISAADLPDWLFRGQVCNVQSAE